MSYLEKTKKLANIIGAYDLDGKQGLSEAEKLSVAFAIEQYGLDGNDVNIDQLQGKNRKMLEEINNKVTEYHKILSGKTPQKQIVYIDFSDFESFYNTQLKTYTKRSYASFKSDYLRELDKHFSIPGKEKLNLKITDKKPQDTSYTTIVLSSKEYKDFFLSDFDRKVQVVKSALNITRLDQQVKPIIERVRTNGSYLSENHVYATVAEQSDFQQFYNGGMIQAMTPILQKEQFGNPDFNEIIYIRAEYFLAFFQYPSTFQQSHPEYQNQKWITQKNGRNLPKEFAQITAHELGHALGLHHVGDEVLKKRIGEVYWNSSIPATSPNIMYQPNQLIKGRYITGQTRFSDFALDYFKFILGVKNKAMDNH